MKRFIPFVCLLIIGCVLIVLTLPQATVAEPAASQAAHLAGKCKAAGSNGTSISCYYQAFRSIARQNGLDYSLEVLADLGNIDSSTRQCHLLAHAIGEGVFERNPTNWRLLVANLSHAGCQEGVIHALLERGAGNSPLTPSKIIELCGATTMWCLHAIGHAVLIDNLASLPKALKVCSGLPDRFGTFLCQEGAFMEYNTGFGLVSHGIVPETWLDWKDRMGEMTALCNQYSGSPKVACWEELAHAALAVYHSDLPAVYRFCQGGVDHDSVWMCQSHATGITLIAMNPNRTMRIKKEFCDGIHWDSDDQKMMCYSAMIVTLLFDTPTAISQAVGYCNLLNAPFAGQCFTTIGGMANRRKSMDMSPCNSAPAEFEQSCRGTNIAPIIFPWDP